MEGGDIWDLAEKAAAEVVAANGGAPPPEGTAYRGVRLRPRGKWSAEIRDSSTTLVWLGSYGTALEAACAYDAAARTLRPDGARTNFPELAATEEEKAARAAVVRAHIAEAKRKRAEKLEKEARRKTEAAEWAVEAAAAAVSAVAPPLPAPETAPARAGGASSSQPDLPSPAAPAANAVASTTPSPHAPAPAPAVSSHFPNAIEAPPPAFGFDHSDISAFHRYLQPSVPTAATSNPSRPSAFRPYSRDGSSREMFRTTGGLTMANIPPAQFQDLYRRFVEAPEQRRRP